MWLGLLEKILVGSWPRSSWDSSYEPCLQISASLQSALGLCWDMYFDMIKGNLQTYEEWNRMIVIFLVSIYSASAFQSLVFGLNPCICPLKQWNIFRLILQIRITKAENGICFLPRTSRRSAQKLAGNSLLPALHTGRLTPLLNRVETTQCFCTASPTLVLHSQHFIQWKPR